MQRDGDQDELMRKLRNLAQEQDIEDIVRWQMTGYLLRKTPTRQKNSIPRCHNCGMEWHGLPKGNCEGSYTDTPPTE